MVHQGRDVAWKRFWHRCLNTMLHVLVDVLGAVWFLQPSPSILGVRVLHFAGNTGAGAPRVFLEAHSDTAA